MNTAQDTTVSRPRSQQEADFSFELYEEHLEEASWLYDLHLSLPYEPDSSWLDLEEFERRFEDHLKALMLGGDLALDLCRQKALAGDYGELHAALRVFCRQNRADLLWEALENAEFDDQDVADAVCHALVAELPKSWEGDLVKKCHESEPSWQSLAARLIGYRQLGVYGRKLTESLEKRSLDCLKDIVWALGRMRYHGARIPLMKLLEDPSLAQEHAILETTALALMRLGETRIVSTCLDHARFHSWPCLVLGLSGSRAVVPALWQIASSPKATPESLLALALIGDASVIDTLISQLPHESLGETAALSLFLLTGVSLEEEVFVPEDIDEDELLEDEKGGSKKGEHEPEEPSPPRGEMQTRLSRNPEQWRAWKKANEGSFERGVRYRLGRPADPSILIDLLRAPKMPPLLRSLAVEELVIRYRIDCLFFTRMFVVDQKRAIQNTDAQIQEQMGVSQPGKWHYAGQEC